MGAIVSNQQPHDCLLNCLFRRRSKKTSKLRVTGLCEGNSPVTSEFPAQRTSYAESVSIWWRHHILEHSSLGHRGDIARGRMPRYLTFEKSVLIRVMAWCRQATYHYLCLRGSRSMSPNGSSGANDLINVCVRSRRSLNTCFYSLYCDWN